MSPHPNDPKGESGSKKTPLHLLPPYALAQTALAHREGAEKYGPWNWRQTGVCATTYIGAIMRHLAAWQDGEDLDPDSGLSHIAKIAACCNILLDAEHCGKLVDDRSKVYGTPCDPASGWGSVNPNYVDAPPDTPAPLPPERFDTSQLIPPPPPRSKLPKGFTKWEYRGKEWTCSRRSNPPYFCNIGLADPLNPPTSAEDVKWTSGSYKRDWPEGMGWYYEAVK